MKAEMSIFTNNFLVHIVIRSNYATDCIAMQSYATLNLYILLKITELSISNLPNPPDLLTPFPFTTLSS
jgi:hypothetical protein